jgi:hypothetical protein
MKFLPHTSENLLLADRLVYRLVLCNTYSLEMNGALVSQWQMEQLMLCQAVLDDNLSDVYTGTFW